MSMHYLHYFGYILDFYLNLKFYFGSNLELRLNLNWQLEYKFKITKCLLSLFFPHLLLPFVKSFFSSFSQLMTSSLSWLAGIGSISDKLSRLRILSSLSAASICLRKQEYLTLVVRAFWNLDRSWFEIIYL